MTDFILPKILPETTSRMKKVPSPVRSILQTAIYQLRADELGVVDLEYPVAR